MMVLYLALGIAIAAPIGVFFRARLPRRARQLVSLLGLVPIVAFGFVSVHAESWLWLAAVATTPAAWILIASIRDDSAFDRPGARLWVQASLLGIAGLLAFAIALFRTFPR